MFLNAKLLTLAFCAVQALALDFADSKWIWTDEGGASINKPPGSRAFRRDYYPPAGKSALSANVLITADNEYTLYLNGKQIGTNANWPTAEAYCVRLAPDCNVFAVNVTNDVGSTVNNPAGLLAAIEIKYTDGFVETVVTDSTWHVHTEVPVGFQQVAFDDKEWSAATVESNYEAGSPWGPISIPPSTGSPQLTLSDANWIWTNEVKSGDAPEGTRAFRKTITLPQGQRATSATIYIAADNEYTLYVQGRIVGSETSWPQAHKYVVDILPISGEITIAVFTRNTEGPAGLIASVDLTMEDCNCGSIASIVTDDSWKYSLDTPSGFEQVEFNDTAWADAVVEGKYGMSPWGDIEIPAAVSSSSDPINGAPSAMIATVAN